MLNALGSSKTRAAVLKLTLCFVRFRRSFLASQTKRMGDYSTYNYVCTSLAHYRESLARTRVRTHHSLRGRMFVLLARECLPAAPREVPKDEISRYRCHRQQCDPRSPLLKHQLADPEERSIHDDAT